RRGALRRARHVAFDGRKRIGVVADERGACEEVRDRAAVSAAGDPVRRRVVHGPASPAPASVTRRRDVRRAGPPSRRHRATAARSVGARVFGERDVAAAANAARRFFGKGPTRSIGERRESVPLAPWLTLVALVPLGLVLGRRGGGSSPRRRPLLLRSARA